MTNQEKKAFMHVIKKLRTQNKLCQKFAKEGSKRWEVEDWIKIP
jgi:hypothetical protein